MVYSVDGGVSDRNQMEDASAGFTSLRPPPMCRPRLGVWFSIKAYVSICALPSVCESGLWFMTPTVDGKAVPAARENADTVPTWL